MVCVGGMTLGAVLSPLSHPPNTSDACTGATFLSVGAYGHTYPPLGWWSSGAGSLDRPSSAPSLVRLPIQPPPALSDAILAADPLTLRAVSPELVMVVPLMCRELEERHQAVRWHLADCLLSSSPCPPPALRNIEGRRWAGLRRVPLSLRHPLTMFPLSEDADILSDLQDRSGPPGQWGTTPMLPTAYTYT